LHLAKGGGGLHLHCRAAGRVRAALARGGAARGGGKGWGAEGANGRGGKRGPRGGGRRSCFAGGGCATRSWGAARAGRMAAEEESEGVHRGPPLAGAVLRVEVTTPPRHRSAPIVPPALPRFAPRILCVSPLTWGLMPSPAVPGCGGVGDAPRALGPSDCV